QEFNTRSGFRRPSTLRMRASKCHGCGTNARACSRRNGRQWYTDSMPSALEARAARLFCVGFRGLAPSPELAELTRRGVRSVVLFARNVGEPRDVAELTRAIKRLAPVPIAIAVDHVGGNVRRLRRGFTQIPCMSAVGRTGDAELAAATGRLLGAELRAVGIDVAFAPVLDVDTNPNNPVIGARSFGSAPELVARLGIALAAGIQ